MKKKKMNKGSLLLEALYGFALLLTAIAFYLPLLMNMLEKDKNERHQTQVSRKVYEQVQHIVADVKESKGQFIIDQREYEWQIIEVGGLKGVQIRNEAAFHYVPIKFEQ